MTKDSMKYSDAAKCLNLTKHVEKVLSNVLLNFGMLEVLEVTYQTYIMIHFTIFFTYSCRM